MQLDHILSLLPLANFGDPIFLIGGIIVIFLGLPLLVFLGLLFETVRMPTYNPEPPERIPPSPPLAAALKAGFTLIGHVNDGDKGIKQGLLSFALSPDGLVLVRIIHSKVGRRTELITRYCDKRWLMTLDQGIINHSRLELIDSLFEAPFEILLLHHQSRFATINQSPLPFQAYTAIADAQQHFRDKYDQRVRLGLARYGSPAHSTWRHTFKGALRHLLGVYFGMLKFFFDAMRSRRRRQELERAMPGGFLVSDREPFSSQPTTANLPPSVPLPQSSASLHTRPASPAHRASESADIPPPV